uniref:Uncharacterized protein n=1 Tax=Glossina austeni TaxID=7395 RepID=A0A1A9USD9_GLOAU
MFIMRLVSSRHTKRVALRIIKLKTFNICHYKTHASMEKLSDNKETDLEDNESDRSESGVNDAENNFIDGDNELSLSSSDKQNVVVQHIQCRRTRFLNKRALVATEESLRRIYQQKI